MIAEAAEVVSRLAGGEAGDAPSRGSRTSSGTRRHSARAACPSVSAAGSCSKAENLQRTGSFKLRGALNTLRAADPGTGVVAASAGNHGQSLAYAARAQRLPCEVFMPQDAPVAKVTAVEAFGGVVTLAPGAVDDCIAAARRACGGDRRPVRPPVR